MKRLFKAILKTLGLIVLYGIIILILNFILDLVPWTTPILFILAIIMQIVIFYFEDKEDK